MSTASSIPTPSLGGRRRSSIAQAAQSNQQAEPAETPSGVAAPEARPAARGPRIAAPVPARPDRGSGPQDGEGPIKKILLSLPQQDKQRMVSTIVWARPHTGIKNQQDFIRQAIGELCDRLEAEYNGGQRFPDVAE